MHLLVVDDDPDLSMLMDIFLRRAGHTVALAGDGQQALDQLNAGLAADMLVIDWMMPRLDGVGLATAVREDRGLRHLPILMVTARHEHGPALEAGVDEILGKPFTGSTLVKAVEQLGQRRLHESA